VPGLVDSLRYNAQGLAVERKYANGVVATARYDYHERVGALKAVDREGKVLQDLSYAYDQAGTLVQVKDALHIRLDQKCQSLFHLRQPLPAAGGARVGG
jgi:hypothetical protein